ncbi:DUF2071 domain-containing protein [Aquimarina sp. U1-2]|uniref:YqjF family protein n=1 Tax=Aquimarina sp. U1-2 TaxID=2823141 RepID=UPI001AECBCC8|nr:DUF2071 domain-containing protein [Aquimarina sp. U1-2]MBP2830755.1 DUF2071 domain-containing protein [Aquimarina sp. U1-2]
MSFLTAAWRNLAFANYEVDPKLLEKYVPYGTELDQWQGKYYVSLIGFLFENVKLLGFSIPFHKNFEEVNLRFYVKRYENDTIRRGVVFVKEIVPKPALSWVANLVYNEKYETLPMRYSWKNDHNSRLFTYQWKKKGKWQSISVKTKSIAKPLEQHSFSEFITEHYWGYSKINNDKTNEYQVTHPRWSMLEVLDYTINVDFGLVYGSDFLFLNNRQPDSIMLAEGSAITIESKRMLQKTS